MPTAGGHTDAHTHTPQCVRTHVHTRTRRQYAKIRHVDRGYKSQFTQAGTHSEYGVATIGRLLKM